MHLDIRVQCICSCCTVGPSTPRARLDGPRVRPLVFPPSLPSLPRQLTHTPSGRRETDLELLPPPLHPQPFLLQPWSLVEPLPREVSGDTITRAEDIQEPERPRRVCPAHHMHRATQGWTQAHGLLLLLGLSLQVEFLMHAPLDVRKVRRVARERQRTRPVCDGLGRWVCRYLADRPAAASWVGSRRLARTRFLVAILDILGDEFDQALRRIRRGSGGQRAAC